MIYRINICANLNSPFVMQTCKTIEGYNRNNFVMPCSSNFYLKTHMLNSKKGSICRLLVLIFCRIVLTQIVCIPANETTYMLEMTCCNSGHVVIFFLTTLSIPILLETSFVFMLCRISFMCNQRRGWLFVKKGRMRRT